MRCREPTTCDRMRLAMETETEVTRVDVRAELSRNRKPCVVERITTELEIRSPTLVADIQRAKV